MKKKEQQMNGTPITPTQLVSSGDEIDQDTQMNHINGNSNVLKAPAERTFTFSDTLTKKTTNEKKPPKKSIFDDDPSFEERLNPNRVPIGNSHTKPNANYDEIVSTWQGVDGVDEAVQMRQPIFYNSDLRTQKRKHDEYDEEYDKGRIKKVKANNIQQEEQQNHQNGTIKKNIFQDAQSFKKWIKE